MRQNRSSVRLLVTLSACFFKGTCYSGKWKWYCRGLCCVGVLLGHPWVQLRTLRLGDLGEIANMQIWEGKKQGLEFRTTSLQNSYSFWPTFILINWPYIYFTFAQRDFHLCTQCPFPWFKLNSNFMFVSSERICQTNLNCYSEKVKETHWRKVIQHSPCGGTMLREEL